MSVDCIICEKVIVKYRLDVADTVHIPQGYVCEECSYRIARQRIAR